MNPDLQERIRRCAAIPPLPPIAVQVMNLIQHADVDMAEIAQVVSRDPALADKILRTVNSTFYARQQTIATISHALAILGLQAVNTLVLGFSLTASLTKLKPQSFKHLAFWKRSIYSATAARLLAAQTNTLEQEEAFLAAMLKDVGMLALDQVLGEAYGRTCAQAATHEDLSRAEAAAGMTHAEAGSVLAEHWKLSPLLATPIAFHHCPEKVADPQLRRLTELVQLSGRCADVFIEAQPAEAILAVRNACVSKYGSGAIDADGLLEELTRRTKEVAGLFEINIGSVGNYEAIVAAANEALVEMTLQSQLEGGAQKGRPTDPIQQNGLASKRAGTDDLTGLPNRAKFDEFLAAQVTQAVNSRQPLSVLLMDVDKFKGINDLYGQAVGDRVLQELGKVLGAVVRSRGMAARHGAEGMAVALPATSRAQAAALAERLRAGIAARWIAVSSSTFQVTASFGVATFDPADKTVARLKAPAHLVKAAELAVYAAKRSGRNCVRVFTLNPTANNGAAPSGGGPPAAPPGRAAVAA
jgi:two-component system, cell cycle response regulator